MRSSFDQVRDGRITAVMRHRQFVVDLAHRRTQTLVRHTVAMAHGLGMVVVGEGVEDERTARLLADAGADVGQGLYFGDAVDLATFVDRLSQDRR